jgi:hypothetical protein
LQVVGGNFAGGQVLSLAAVGALTLDGVSQSDLMIPHLRSSLSLVLFLIVFWSAPLSAQIQVSMRMTKSEYVANEPVQAVLTLTNRAGRDVKLYSEGPQSWLDFQIKNVRGVPLSPIRGTVVFQAVHLPTGQSVSKTFTISDHYRASELGRYNGFASIRMPGSAVSSTITSNRIRFEVTKARVIYRQKVGVPGSKALREFRMMSFTYKKKSLLYVEVVDEATGRALQTYSLGEALMFRKPSFTVDGASNLHVLYLSTPIVYTHARINPDGRFLGQNYFKRASTGNPRFVTFANGEVKVAGGVPYDPAQEQAVRAQIRRLSERPPFAYN